MKTAKDYLTPQDIAIGSFLDVNVTITAVSIEMVDDEERVAISIAQHPKKLLPTDDDLREMVKDLGRHPLVEAYLQRRQLQ